MLRRDFTLAALVAPLAGLLGKKPETQSSPPQQYKPRDTKTGTPLWDIRKEMEDFLCRVFDFYYKSSSIAVSLSSCNQRSICKVTATYHNYSESFVVGFNEELRYWSPEDAVLELRSRLFDIMRKLEAKVLGFKETT